MNYSGYVIMHGFWETRLLLFALKQYFVEKYTELIIFSVLF